MTFKSIALVVLLSVGLASSAKSQSQFALCNCPPQCAVNAPVFDAQGALLAGTGWRGELWGGADSNSLAPLYILYSGGRNFAPLFTPGCFRSTKLLVLGGVLAGAPAWLQVRVWESSLGATYEGVVPLNLGGYGQSLLFQAVGTDPYADPPMLPSELIGLQSFSVLAVVPEPATWAVLALGGLGLYFVARHRRR
jgi:hypothetical protein